MDLNELSNGFDVLWNNIASNQAANLDEYEKSVFLTNAMYDLLKNYFDPKGNKFQEGFDMSKKRQADFSNLIRTVVLDELDIPEEEKFDYRSKCYGMPTDLFIPINEKLTDNKTNFVITPISFIEYDALMLKPYQYPIKRQVWRLLTDKHIESTKSVEFVDNEADFKYHLIVKNTSNKIVHLKITKDTELADGTLDITVEGDTVTIICTLGFRNTTMAHYWSHVLLPAIDETPVLKKYIGDMTGNGDGSSWPSCKPVSCELTVPPASPIFEIIGRFVGIPKYTMRYLIKPRPIILVDLPDNLTIEGYNKASECELDSELHYEILQRAVELAKAAYQGDLSTQIVLGQNSQTNMGIVSQQQSK